MVRVRTETKAADETARTGPQGAKPPPARPRGGRTAGRPGRKFAAHLRPDPVSFFGCIYNSVIYTSEVIRKWSIRGLRHSRGQSVRCAYRRKRAPPARHLFATRSRPVGGWSSPRPSLVPEKISQNFCQIFIDDYACLCASQRDRARSSTYSYTRKETIHALWRERGGVYSKNSFLPM